MQSEIIGKVKGMAICDLHLRSKDLEVKKNALARAIDLFLKEKRNLLLLGGDVFDEGPKIGGREYSVGSVESVIVEELDRVVKSGAEVVVIPGNHDLAGADQKDALSCLDRRPGIHVVRMATARLIRGVHICCLPWITKAHLKANLPEGADLDVEFAKRIDGIVEMFSQVKGPKILLGHCEIVGSMMQKYSLVGGDFPLTRMQIGKIGADLNILGHIHKRQEDYVGSLTQNTFGEEGNPTGVMIFESIPATDGVWVKSEFQEIITRRYWNADESILEEPEPALGLEGDHLKIQCRKEALEKVKKHIEAEINFDPSDEFIPIDDFYRLRVSLTKESSTVARRTEEEFMPDDEPVNLFTLWAKETGQEFLPWDPEKVFAKVAEVGSGISESPMGSLDRILWIRLEKIGRHEETFIDLRDMSGLIGICGRNGVGKTFILESLIAAAYGEFISRKGALYNRVTRGHLGKALIEVAFESSGKKYVMCRKISRTAGGGGHEAYVGEIIECNGEERRKAIAGPKAGDVLKKAISILGDPDLLMASTFSSQDQAGDLIDAKPSKRKDIFAGMVGSERLLEIGEKAKGKKDDANKEWDSRAIAVTLLEETINKYEGKDQELIVMETELMGMEAAYGVIGDQLDEKKAVAMQLDQRRKGFDSLRKEKDGIQNAISQVDKALEYSRMRKKELGGVIEKEEEVRKDLEEFKEIEVKIAQGFDLSQKEKTLAQKDYDNRGEQNTARDGFRDRLEEINGKISAINVEVQTKSREISGISQMARVAEDDYFDTEKCPECPLLKHSRDAKWAIEKLTDEVVKLKELLEQAKVNRTDQQQKWRIFLDGLEGGRRVIVADLDGVREELMALGYDDLVKRKSELQGVEGRVAEIEGAKSGLIAVRVNIKEKEERKATLEERKLKVMLDLAGENEVTVEQGKVQAEIDAILNQRKADLICIQGTIREIGSLEEQVKLFKEAKGSIPEKIIGREAAWDEVQQWEMVQGAFSRDGIPQFIADTALPQFHGILEEVLTLFDGRFGIRLKTQASSIDGNLREELGILISDDLGYEADIGEYSGGEKRLIKSVFRIATTLFQAQRLGRRHRVYFADEAFDMLDGQNSSALQEVFRMLTKDLNQVILTSHSDHLLAEIENKICL